MSIPVAVLRLKVRRWAPVDVGRQSTVSVASTPGLMSNVTGPPTRCAPSQTSRIAPTARFVPTLWATTRTWASLLKTGSDANWTSEDEIARSGQVKSVKVRGRMLFRSFVSRVAPPSVTEDNGGVPNAGTGRLDSRGAFGRPMVVGGGGSLFLGGGGGGGGFFALVAPRVCSGEGQEV